MPSRKRLKDYDASKLAELLHMALVRNTGDQIVLRPITKQGLPDYSRALLISENGGEVNITKVVQEDLKESVPYWDNHRAGGAIGEAALAYRILQVVCGKPINYKLDLDQGPSNG